LLNKIIEEVKKTESTADNIIKEADNKADKIINNAHEEVNKLIEKINEETKEEGKVIIEREEGLAKKEELGKDSLKNIDKAVKIVTKKLMEGK